MADPAESAPAYRGRDVLNIARPAHIGGGANYSLASGSGLLFFAQLIGNTGLFVSVLLVARALGPEGRGTAAFLLVTAQVVARIATFGLPEATLVLAADRGKRRALLTNLITFAALSSLLLGIATALGLLLLGQLRPAGIGPVELALLLAAICSNAVMTASEHFLQGCGAVRQRALIILTWPWLYAGVVVVLSQSVGLDVTHVASGWIIGQVVAGSYGVGTSVMRSGIGPLDLPLLANSLRFGLRLWVGSLALFLNFRVDQILMGFIASRATLGIYAVAVNLSETLLLLPTAVASALPPIIAGSRPRERLERTLRALHLLLVVTVVSVVVAAVVGPIVLPLIFGPAFTTSIVPFMLLLPGALGFAVMRLFSASLLGASAPGLSSAAALVSLFVGIVLDLLLIPRYGAEGAAAAASIAFIAGGLVSVIAYRIHTAFGWAALFGREKQRALPISTAQPADLPLRGANIVCLSGLDWDYVWQAHQEITYRFAASGNRVVFVDNTGGVRSVRLADASRVFDRFVRALMQAIRGERRAAENLVVLAPLLIPFVGNRLAQVINARVLIPRLAAKIRSLAGPNPVIYTYLPTADALEIIDLVGGPNSVLVYHCVSNFEAAAQHLDALLANEREVVRRSDLVVVQSGKIAERFASINPRVHNLGIGVNLTVFDPDKVEETPEELRDLPRPIIGYIGSVHRHVDMKLLSRIADAHPNGSVVIAGPTQVDLAPLRAHPNIVLLGARPHGDLPALVAAFDVGLIPYARNPYTETVNPTKLYEYLAMGVPVVSTDLPEVIAQQLPPFALRLARDHEQFLQGLREALEAPDPLDQARRRRIALDHDWKTVVEKIASLIVERRQGTRATVAS